MSSISPNLVASQVSPTSQTITERLRENLEASPEDNAISQALQDVAALSTATALQTEVSNLQAASTNVAQANNFLQVADGGLEQIGDLLERAATLSVQAQSPTLDDATQAALDTEFQAITEQIDLIAETTNFNGVNLLDGSLAEAEPIIELGGGNNPTITQLSFESIDDGDVIDIDGTTFTAGTDFAVEDTVAETVDSFVVAANTAFAGTATFSANEEEVTIEVVDPTAEITINTEASTAAIESPAPVTFPLGSEVDNVIEVSLPDTTTEVLLGSQSLSLLTTEGAGNALEAVGVAIDNIVASRSQVGVIQGALEEADTVIDTAIQNQEAARATLTDPDIAELSTQTAQALVQQEATVSFLAQSNLLQDNLLELLS